MIGPGGDTLIGKYAKKRLLPSRWKIIAVKRTHLPISVLVYKLSLAGLKTTEVVQDDDDWELAELDVTPEERLLIGYLTDKTLPNVSGSVATWLTSGEDPDKAISSAVLMDKEAWATETMHVLWSGGAADCIIVAMYTKTMTYLTHATRISCSAIETALFRMGHDVKIYLASQYFKHPDTCVSQGTVKDIVGALKRYNVVAVFGSDRLAIDSKTGAVLSEFTNPRSVESQPELMALKKQLEGGSSSSSSSSTGK